MAERRKPDVGEVIATRINANEDEILAKVLAYTEDGRVILTAPSREHWYETLDNVRQWDGVVLK